MSMNPKWLLALIALAVIVAYFCLINEGSFIGEDQSTKLNALMDAGWSNPKAVWDLIWGCATWDFNFFQTGIGVLLKIPLVILSIVIIVPLGFDVLRLIRRMLPF